MSELPCEACGKAPAKNNDILCPDCDWYYTILLDLVDEHPELDLDRLREIYEWRMKKIQTRLIREAPAP